MEAGFAQLIPNIHDEMKPVFVGLVMNHMLTVYLHEKGIPIRRHMKALFGVIKIAMPIGDDRNMKPHGVDMRLSIDMPNRFCLRFESENPRAAWIQPHSFELLNDLKNVTRADRSRL